MPEYHAKYALGEAVVDPAHEQGIVDRLSIGRDGVQYLVMYPNRLRAKKYWPEKGLRSVRAPETLPPDPFVAVGEGG